MKNFGSLKFKTTLKDHFETEPQLVTEDAIRYWFIKEYENTVSKQTPYTEVPYKRQNKDGDYITPLKCKPSPALLSDSARADLYYGKVDFNSCQLRQGNGSVFEFKYHRSTRYSDCCTGTDCGSVFRDLNRLSILENKEKYFVYVFDDVMKKYYDDKIEANHASVFDIFDVANTGKTVNVDSGFDDIIFNKNDPSKANRGYGEIKKGAFSQFDPSSTFDKFNYEVEVLYSDEIWTGTVDGFNKDKNADKEIEKSYYLLICQVLDGNNNDNSEKSN